MTDSFSRFARPVQKWIHKQSWAGLRDIQEQALHAILDSDSDILISAATASGKTEAAFLPLLSQVWNEPSDGPGFDLVYVSPLKSLINDQYRRIDDICLDMELPVVPWHGDISASVKSKASNNPKGVLLITPESLEAMFVRRGRDVPGMFNATRAIIIDEFHSTFNSERGVQICSLLSRINLAAKRNIRRIALSATIGDAKLASEQLRPGGAGSVEVIESTASYSQLKLLLKGFISTVALTDSPQAIHAVSEHIFQNLRGSSNLVFAGSRQLTELLSDCLRELCEEANLPQEFYPHHANLSGEHREFIEKRLLQGKLPTTAVCTSTLELGIDINEVDSIAQIGAPFSVASLRQRLGRSGRSAGKSAILRQYSVEAAITPKSSFADGLRLRLIRTIATIDLLLEGWYEPPQPRSLHLSTLVHQILSVIAERGGARAATLHKILCEKGVFSNVPKNIFIEVLRSMGNDQVGLLEQESNGILLLGPKGEKLTEHHSFYAVFHTPEEYRVIEGGRNLGTYPVASMLAPGMTIIFSGRRWLVREVRDREREIFVSPTDSGEAPVFSGDAGMVHDRVVDRMFNVLEGDAVPEYLDSTARDLLEEARHNHSQMQFNGRRLTRIREKVWAVATRCGSIKTNTLALALRSKGYTVHSYVGFLEVSVPDSSRSLPEALARLAKMQNVNLFSHRTNLHFEKYHPYLTRDLLIKDALSCRLDKSSLSGLCKEILGKGVKSEDSADAEQEFSEFEIVNMLPPPERAGVDSADIAGHAVSA